MSMRKNYLALTLLALPLCLLACGGEDNAPPVAQVEISPKQAHLGFPEMQAFQVTWSPSAELEGLSSEPMVFVHLLDENRKVVRTYDQPLPQKWQAGTPMTQEIKVYQSQLAPPLSPGKYTLTLGLYEGKERWPLGGLGEKVDDREYIAAEVEVPQESSTPKVVYSPQWLPVEPGADRQVLVRRWLTDKGAVRLEGVRAPGSLWMVLRIPPIDPANERLELEGTASSPGLLVRGSCGGFEMSVSGPGSHEIEVPVEPSGNGVCRVGLNPNYTIVSAASGQRRSVSLENLAWFPGERRAGQGPATPAPASPTAPADR